MMSSLLQSFEERKTLTRKDREGERPVLSVSLLPMTRFTMSLTQLETTEGKSLSLFSLAFHSLRLDRIERIEKEEEGGGENRRL